MYFEIVGDIKDVEVIAEGPSIRQLAMLRARYGEGKWRKLKAGYGCGWRVVDSIGLRFTGTRPMGSAVNASKSNDFLTEPLMSSEAPPHFGACVKTTGCEDLQVRKLYAILPYEAAERAGLLRVVDDSGEDYLYPAENFIPLPLPASVEQALAALPSPA